MPRTFGRAPLMEAVAEVRWPVPSNAAGISISIGADNPVERMLSSFGDEVARGGFLRSERLVPPGVPWLLFQPIARFRSADLPSVFFQLGPGVLSVHGIPPYESWATFSQFVRTGVAALRISVPDFTGKKLPRVTLRYINAFDADLMGKREPADFIKNVLGFSLVLPEPAHKFETENMKTRFQLEMSISEEQQFVLSVGDGVFKGGPATIFDMAVTSFNVPEEETEDKLEKIWTTAHEFFEQVTLPIHELMQAKGDD